MKIALVEISLSGHRTTYLSIYTNALVKAGHEISIFCPEPDVFKKNISDDIIKHVNFHNHILPNQKPFWLKRFNHPLGLLANWKTISRAITDEAPQTEFVFFMWLDSFILDFSTVTYFRIPFYKLLNILVPRLVDLHFPFKWSGIYFSPQKNSSYLFKSKNNVSIGLLNEDFNFTNQFLNSKRVLVPDITNTSILEEKTSLEKTILNKADGRKIISVIGSLERRKSIITLLDIAEKCKDKNYFFLFAGELFLNTFTQEEVIRINGLNNETENCFFLFERIPDGNKFNSLINLSDIIFASYLNFPNSSNILTKIAFFNKPVIVSKNGCMGFRVKKYKLGEIINEGEMDEAIVAIENILNSFDNTNARFKEYFANHSDIALTNKIPLLVRA